MVVVAACSSPADQPAAPPQPPAVVATAHGAPTASADVPAPTPAAGRVFRPIAPLVSPALASMNAAAKCKVGDHELGDAFNVVEKKGQLYPVRIAFNASGGMAAWMTEKGMAVRALDTAGVPVGGVVATAAWDDLPTLTALPDGFVLSDVASKRLMLLELGGDAKPRGEKVTLEISLPTGLVQAVVRTGPKELAMVGEPERPDNGPMLGASVHVITVRLDGAAPRAEARSFAVKDFYGDGEAFAGTYGDRPALLLLRGSGDFTVLTGTELESPGLGAVAFDDRPTVQPWQLEGGSSSGFDYGFGSHPRTPILESEPSTKPGPARFTLTDPDWRGLPDFQWSGTHFVTGRLSLKGKKTRARVFAIDCR